MIRSNAGEVLLDGSLMELIADMTCALKQLKELLEEEVGEEHTAEIITAMGKIVYTGDVGSMITVYKEIEEEE